MTDRELARAFADLRPLITSIIGFHGLSEDEEHPPSPEDRVQYDAHVYAGGIELARRVLRIAYALSDED